MMSGIRIRLLVAVGLVVAASIATVGYISSRIARSEFHRFLLEESSGENPVSRPLLDRLAGYHRSAGGWSGVGALLAELAGQTAPPSRLLLLDDEGTMAGASTPDLAGAITTLEGDLLMIRMKGDDGDVQLAFRGGWTDVIDSAGSRIGRLYSLPPDHEPGGGPESHFMLSVNRWLIGLVSAAGLLALGITALVARRILGPVEELTTAARAMERGDLGRRVTVRSEDEIGKLGKAFNAMAEGLERTETLRRRMVSDVAHELRTPLTSIRCQIEALRDGLVTPDPGTIVSIEEDIVSLQHVVDDLQDLALAEAGQIRLERQSVTLAVEAARVIRSFASDGGPEISIDLEGLPPAEVDPARFRQILRNLLSNAITHTPPDGTIIVTGRTLETSIELTVKDTGTGIAPEDLPHVFECFYRADPSRQRATGGAGIGLAIAKELVEAHGGTITVTSTPGDGAAFRLTLPRAFTL